MDNKFIKPDQFFEVPMCDGDEEYNFVVNAKFDSIHVQKELGIWILKMMDDEQGLIQAIMTEEQARKLADFALLPIVERPFLYKSEHELYVEAIAERLDQIWDKD